MQVEIYDLFNEKYLLDILYDYYDHLFDNVHHITMSPFEYKDYYSNFDEIIGLNVDRYFARIILVNYVTSCIGKYISIHITMKNDNEYADYIKNNYLYVFQQSSMIYEKFMSDISKIKL